MSILKFILKWVGFSALVYVVAVGLTALIEAILEAWRGNRYEK